LIKNGEILVKVLGGVALSKPITVIADKFSKSAIEAIESAGGKAVVLLDESQKK
jgi:large subunit ribosomal protein L15